MKDGSAEGGTLETDAATDSSAGPRAVHRALELLTRVVEEGPQPLSELARASGLPTSTTLRILRALEHWGYISRTNEHQYEPGRRFVESRITAEPPRSEELIDASAEVLQRLAADTSESSYLAVPGPAHTCIYLREVQSDQPIRHVGFSGWAGRTVPMAHSAVGEVLEGRTPEVGYAVLDAVVTPEATVIAAPVLDTSGIIAALSIVGPSFRMSSAVIRELGPRVRAAADELTRLMSGAPDGAAGPGSEAAISPAAHPPTHDGNVAGS